jgi:DNA-binding MarR family transcriptional regulator
VQSAAAKIPGVIPVAVLAGERLSESLADQIVQFGMRNAPNVAVGVVDADGLSHFSGFGLDSLNAKASLPRSVESFEKSSPAVNLFSDLNQWMLKVLLSEGISEDWLSAPRGPYENASKLAEAARVSLMSASRFVRQLSEEGFVEQHRSLRLVRIEDLLDQWQAARRRAREIPLRWILREKNKSLASALRSYAHSRLKKLHEPQFHRDSSRICLALYAAAEKLGLKFVHGAQAHFYLEKFDQRLLHEIGLSAENADHQVDVFVRIPESPEAVFRAAVDRDGVPVADVLQIWLDVSAHPSRGREQADIIRREILSDLRNKGWE